MRTKLKNMGHGALTRNGIALPRSAFASRLSRARLSKRDDLAPADALIMQAALRQIEELDREVEALGTEVVRVGKGLAGVQRLLQVHGMNLLSAISLLAEIGDINLFESSKQLTAYAGLATSTRQSNETTRHGGITKRGRKRLRTVAINTVLSMVNRTRTPLMEFYQKKKKDKGSGKAICATARKLLTIIFVMLKKGLDYWYLEDRLYNRKLRLLDAAV
jgi:transposase